MLLIFIHLVHLVIHIFNLIYLKLIKENNYLIKLDGLIIFLYPIMEIVKF